MAITDYFDLNEFVKRIIKYLIEGFIIGIVCYTIAKNRLTFDEIVIISLTASVVFSMLDTYMPAIAVSARTGAGFGVGAALVGFPLGI
jgi:hypothetical protein